MTTPPAPVSSDAMLAQVLLKLGEISTDVAVIKNDLKDLPDHEVRIRSLETSRAKIYGAAALMSIIFSALGSWIGLTVGGH
jgi:hypothetical protein